MKYVDIVRILHGIATHPTDRKRFYVEYIEASIEEAFGEVSEDVRNMLLEKSLMVFSRFGNYNVRYAPEMEIVVPYCFASKRPMINWKGLKEEKYRRLRTLCMMAGQAITAGFRLNRRIAMIDIDVKGDIKDRILEVIDEASSIGLPVKLTWSGGAHIYVPARTDMGIVLEHGEHTYLNTAPPAKGENAVIEVKIDAVTVHPLQSWLWVEHEYGGSGVTLKRCAIPNKAPSINWFVYGKPISLDVREAVQAYEQVIDMAMKYLKVEISVKMREATLEDLSKNMLEVKEGTVGEGAKRGRTSLYEGSRTVLRRDITFQQFVQFLREIYSRYIYFKCVHYLVFAEGEEPPNPHFCNIVGWYITQHLKLWTRDEVERELAPFTVKNWNARRKKSRERKVMMYYWDYYACPVEIDGVVYYLRPRYVPQLHQAWSLLHDSGYCRDCPFEHQCLSYPRSASRSINMAINSLVLDIALHFTELVHYLDPVVYSRALSSCGRFLPLPLPAG